MEPFSSQGIIANSPLSRSHSHVAEHLVLVPATEAPYVCRKNSVEKFTMSADVLLMFCTETLVPFGALEHPNLCKKVCYVRVTEICTPLDYSCFQFGYSLKLMKFVVEQTISLSQTSNSYKNYVELYVLILIMKLAVFALCTSFSMVFNLPCHCCQLQQLFG